MVDKEIKQEKLKRLTLLRIMNCLGMVSWRSDGYDAAKQKLRLVHPLTWLWIVLASIYAVFYEGVPQAIDDISYLLKNETVWY